MTPNEDTRAALEYHEATKHSYASIRVDMHYLDWANKPMEFKAYHDLPRIPLPTDFGIPVTPTLEALAPPPEGVGRGAPLDLPTLTTILYFSGGLTKKVTLANGHEFYFRAAACAGALYPIEFYVVSGPLDGLAPGVYHFSPLDMHLRCLREGDHRGYLAGAAPGEGVRGATATVVLSAITWRSSWKYQARSYRYHFWDAGTILANLLAVATSEGQGAAVVMGFIDDQVNHLLGLDGEGEKALALIPLGRGLPAPGYGGEPSPIKPRVEPLSQREMPYPLITAMHGASVLRTRGEAEAWAGALERPTPPPGPGPRFPLETSKAIPSRPLGRVILRRGSTRFFSHLPVEFAQLSTILARATEGFKADFLGGASPIDTYLIANAVEGIPAGAYYFSPAEGSLELLRRGSFRGEAGYLCLEQDLGADAAATLFFLSDLRAVLKRFGNRGYRAAQIQAGIIGGRTYLAAYALGLGATGLTFYDDDVAEFFSPHAAGKDAIFVVAVGRSARGRSHRVERLRVAAPKRPGG
jgi:SagB-type dehydrogenase family enzyme